MAWKSGNGFLMQRIEGGLVCDKKEEVPCWRLVMGKLRGCETTKRKVQVAFKLQRHDSPTDTFEVNRESLSQAQACQVSTPGAKRAKADWSHG